MATPKRKLVYVHWVDACSHDSWQSIHHITPALLDSYTVGYLVAENKEAVSVASTVNDSNDACCIMHIPKKWIKERGTLNIETKQRKSQRQDLPAVGKGSDYLEVSFGAR